MPTVLAGHQGYSVVTLFCAESFIVMVQTLEASPEAGTFGVNSMLRACDLPRLSKYSSELFSTEPSAPTSVPVAGKFAEKVIFVVGSCKN